MKTIALALVSSLAAACYAANDREFPVRTAISPDAPIARYRAFSFGWTEGPPTGHQTSSRTLAVERRMRNLIESALQQRGYVEDNAHPNFVVRFGAGVEHVRSRGFEEIDVMRSDDDDYVDFQEIELDMFDASTKTAIWRSSAVSQVDLTKAIDEGLLQHDVERLLASFPARSVAAEPPVAAPAATTGPADRSPPSAVP
jgi:hypothetical protein